MFGNRLVTNVCFALLFACASVAHAQKTQRTPLGLYAKVDVETAIEVYTGPAADLHTHLRHLYANLLANPAISGLNIGQRWDHIQIANVVDPRLPNLPPYHYDWSFLDDAFAEAETAHKTIALTLTPGLDAPPKLLQEIPSCDFLFSSGWAPQDCGRFEFVGVPQAGKRADGTIFPLPWNEVYESAWGAFLELVNDRYKDDQVFVSIAIAGPVGASDEMILPTTANDDKRQLSGKTVDDTWEDLIEHSFPHRSDYYHNDQVFVDSWKKAIDTYEHIFRNVTLVLIPDAGNDLPEFNDKQPSNPSKLFEDDCSKEADFVMSCNAKTKILEHFGTTSGDYTKATQVGGMTAASPKEAGNIGVAGAKLFASLFPDTLAGATFDHPVSTDTQGEGCPAPGTCPDLTVVDAAYNVLTVYFTGTSKAKFYNANKGGESIQYLEVPYLDVQYATEHPCAETSSIGLSPMSLQDLLNRASNDIFAMAGYSVALPPSTICRGRF